MKKALIPVAVSAVMLAGCGSMSGLDAQTSFSCKAPAGVSCQSISGTYSNSTQDNLPFQQNRKNGGDANASAVPAGPTEQKSAPNVVKSPDKIAKLSPKDMAAMNSGMPIRQAPLVLRVWVSPYEDEQNDLHDQAYFYTMVHSGKWLIEANRSAISNQFRPVFPLKGKQPADDPKDVSSAAAPLGAAAVEQAGDRAIRSTSQQQ
jgi:conjugal transfer pilus assembly protein TraV